MQVRCSFKILINFLYKAKTRKRKKTEKPKTCIFHFIYKFNYCTSYIPYISNKRTGHNRIWKASFSALVLYTGKGLAIGAFGFSAFTCVLVRKKKPSRSNKGQFFCLKCTVSYTYLPVYSQ